MGANFAAPFALLRPLENNFLQQANQYAQLKAMAQERDMRAQQMQMQQMQLQAAQREAEDQQIMSRAWQDANGDPDKTLQLAGQRGALPKTLIGWQQATAQMKEARLKLSAEERAAQDAKFDALHSLLQPVVNETDPTKQQAGWNNALAAGVKQGYLTADEAAQHPYQGPDGVKQYANTLNTLKWLSSSGPGPQELAQRKFDLELAEKRPQQAVQAISALALDKDGVPVDMDAYRAKAAKYPDILPPTPHPGDLQRIIQGSIPPEKKQELDIRRKELDIREREAQAKIDPLGLGIGAPGAAVPGAALTAPAGPGPTPLAREIAAFEGFGKSGSVAQRNNNPGNLRAGAGATGTDKQGYAIFPNEQAGWAALEDLIQKRSTQGLTLQEFIGGKPGVYAGYAPAADKNDPATYAATIGKNLGVDTNTPISSIVGATAQSGGTTGAPGRTGIYANLTGDDLLKRLPTAIANQIKGMAEGRLAIPSGRVLSTPYGQQIMELVSQYDPSFDVNNPGKRMATAKDFAAGKSAQQVNALNTVIGHMDSLSQAADRLKNTGFQPYNSLKNWIAAKTGDPDITTFDVTKKAVTDELTRVWRGTGGSEQDIKSWAKDLDEANSPEQLHGAIAQIGDLLESKLNSLKDQYQQGMGAIAQGREMITPTARATLDRLEKKAGKAPATPAGGGSLPTITTKAQFDALPSGASYLGKDGNTYRKP